MKKYRKYFILAFLLFSLSYGYFVYQANSKQPETNTEIIKSQEFVDNVEKENTIDKKEITEEIPNQPKLNLYATSAVLMDADSNRVLFEKNGHEKMPMASTTKIMTCIVALENGNLDDIVTTSAYAAKMPDVQLNIREGEQYYLKDLLYSLMLESHNDAAVAIAEHIGGTVEGFASMMNQKARDLGCFDTYFITPNGLDASDANGTHSTTATELARILSYCIKESPQKEEFLSITRANNYSFSDIGGNRSFSCNNHNAFLAMMEGALSGKTGFTADAGYCYVGALERDGKSLIVALLACGWPNNKSYKWSDTKQLMNYGLENFSYKSFDEVGIDEEKLQPVLVHNGQTATISQKAYTDVEVIKNSTDSDDNKPIKGILLKNDETIDVSFQMEEELTAPVIKGMEIGAIIYKVNNEILREYSIVTTRSIKKIDYKWCFGKIYEKFLMSGTQV